MENRLSTSVRKVKTFLETNGYPCTIKEMPESTKTAEAAASAVGCEVAQIAKSIIFKNKETKNPVLVVASGKNRISLSKIEAATGIKLSMANGKFVKKRIGYAIGGVPPVAHDEPLYTLLDQDLKLHDMIWAAAGNPNALFCLNPEDLSPMTQGTWLDLAE